MLTMQKIHSSISFKIWKENWPGPRAGLTLLISGYRDNRWSPHRFADWGLSGQRPFQKQGSGLPAKLIQLVPQCLLNLPQYSYDWPVNPADYLLWNGSRLYFD